MQSNGVRALVAIGAIGAIVVLFIVLSGGDGGDTTSGGGVTTTTATGAGAAADEPAAAAIPTVVVKNGKPEGGVRDLTFAHGDVISFRVRSDTADEVHVHGYDIGKGVAAGDSVSFEFPADIEGVFEVELENAGVQIAELTVKP